MERVIFSDEDLRDCGFNVPSTVEEYVLETIDGVMNRDIAELQREFWAYVHDTIERKDEFVHNAMIKYDLDNLEQAEAVVMNCMEKSFAARRKIMQTSIEALHGLAEYRRQGFREWQNSHLASGVVGIDGEN